MNSHISLEGALSLAAALPEGEARDTILYHLEKQDYPRALMVCSEAIIDGLKRETDLSVDELRRRMRMCGQLEKLEKTVSMLARDAREAQRLRVQQARTIRREMQGPGKAKPRHRPATETSV